jgi:hypothetical protein
MADMNLYFSAFVLRDDPFKTQKSGCSGPHLINGLSLIHMFQNVTSENITRKI